MSVVLINLQSKQQITLDDQNPFIIGRGNVDGCHDKRVSRKHGRISCTIDGKIRLVALNGNPCFFTKNGVPPVVQLNKDEEEILSEGDCLGLLPNAFWFQISTKKDIQVKKEANESDNTKVAQNDLGVVKEEETENKFQPNDVEVLNIVKSMPTTCKDSCPVPSLSTETVLKSEDAAPGFGSPEFEKTKRLPLWMYEIDETVESDKSFKRHALPNDEETKNKRPKVLSDVKKELNDKSDETQLGNEVMIVPSTSKQDNCSDSVPTSSAEVQKKSSSVPNQKEGYESGVDSELENIFSKRPICQYEGNCYRKSMQHRLDFCHPGDADYTPYEERPVCQYGSACYRKNESHRVQFRHNVPSSSLPNDSNTSRSQTALGEERPPCLNGSSCWNKNPQHRRDLYHPPKGFKCHFSRCADSSDGLSPVDGDSGTSPLYYDSLEEYYDFTDSDDDFFFPNEMDFSPVPAERKRGKVKNENYYFDDDSEYDLDDPFINDASSDEYIPSESDSEEEIQLEATQDE